MKKKALSHLAALGLAVHFLVAPAAEVVSAMEPQLSAAEQESEDPLRDLQWGLDSINAEKAWTVTRGRKAKVAVLDSGIQASHPDLTKNVSRRAGWACKGDPRVDPSDSGHGTMVAGVIAARGNNGIGISGVAPEATLIPAVGDGGCFFDEAIRQTAELGAHVINISAAYGPEGDVYEAKGELHAIKKAVRYAWSRGAVIVAGAGNLAQPLCGQPWRDVPVICVGALDRHDLSATYSNKDVGMVSDYVMAPGGDGVACEDGIITTHTGKPLPVDFRRCGELLPDYYRSTSGTSLAAPHVAGVAALLSTLGLDNREIVDCILSTTSDLGTPGRDPLYGYGKVDAWRAVSSCR